MMKSTVGVNLLSCVVLLLNSVTINAQEVVQHPMNTTVCEGNTATFTCVVFYPSGIILTSPGWLRNGVIVNPDSMARHSIIDNRTDSNPPVFVSSTLTISRTSTTFDDGIMYQCGVSTAISNTVTLNVAGPPSAVSNIRFDKVCTTSVTVSWNASTSNSVCGPLNYTVSLSPNVNQGPFITSDTSISLTGLAINNFLVTILSTNNAGDGNSLAEPTTLPNTADAVPEGVENLRNTRNASSRADIAWDAPAPNMYCGPILYYAIFITNGNTNRTINSTELTTTIDGLMSNTTYNIRVVAINEAGIGMSETILITTAATGSSEPDNGSGGGLSGGAIAGIVIAIIIGIILIILIVIAAIYFLKRYKRDQNGILTNSPDPSSPNKKKAASNEPKGKDTKPSKQKDKQANKTEYAELQISSTGTAPSVDPTKVDYTAVKEHEPLSYAEVQHDKRAGEKPIQGAPQVEYKEVWHQ